MSNHDGSRMLNDVIALLRREAVFERMGKAHSRRIVSEMITRAVWEHDCNHSEILDGHGAALGLCWDCMKPSRSSRPRPVPEVPDGARLHRGGRGEGREGHAAKLVVHSAEVVFRALQDGGRLMRRRRHRFDEEIVQCFRDLCRSSGAPGSGDNRQIP